MANTMEQESYLITLLNSPGYALLYTSLQEEWRNADFMLHKADASNTVLIARLQERCENLERFMNKPQSMLKDLQHPKGE